ncbi:hypothetical protein G9A89_001766 [Geosiphon pyriformis]|nr:hypothetical protein G9A89_001766 [Geosiphon pyriformis]
MILDSELSIKPRTISTKLSTYDATANLSTTSLSANNTSNLSIAVPAYLLAAVSTTVINDKLLAVIFPFKFEKPSQTPLFSKAALEKKTITAMYTDAKLAILLPDNLYIALLDLIKEQELKWFSDNNESIMPERVHDTNVGFDLRYPKKDLIKLELYLHICIDLKIALEILATIMIQLAFRSSLVKKKINIREEIINTEYVENIIAILQNNSEKTYIIDSNKKIAQAIFLSLVKIAQLVSVKNREELGITARKIQEFGFIGRIDVPVNMAEKEIVDKREIIFIHQPISILSYNQYMVTIRRKVKNQVQIFEVEATFCESRKIGLVNLHIPAKNHNHIKILIYNNMGDIIKIPEGIIIGYLTTEIEEQLPNTIPDFSQLCRYVNITSQTIYEQKKCYLLQPKQLEQINLENLDPLQCIQLKILLNNFNDIFASENKFGKTDII